MTRHTEGSGNRHVRRSLTLRVLLGVLALVGVGLGCMASPAFDTSSVPVVESSHFTARAERPVEEAQLTITAMPMVEAAVDDDVVAPVAGFVIALLAATAVAHRSLRASRRWWRGPPLALPVG